MAHYAAAAAGSGGNVEYPIGSKVKITFRGEQTVGEVSSCNGKDQCMVVRRQVEEKPGQSVITMYNLSQVQVEVLERNKKAPVPVSSLPRVDMSKANRSAHLAVQEKLAEARRASSGDPQVGQVVCDRLNVSGFNCMWNRTDLVVLDSVRIKPPYKAENAIAEPNARTNEEFVQRIRKIVSDSNPSASEMS
eukprot:scpid101362/ scgid35104/ Protein LSM12 homolog A